VDDIAEEDSKVEVVDEDNMVDNDSLHNADIRYMEDIMAVEVLNTSKQSHDFDSKYYLSFR
jgi:hypothetical protein